ncbi:hypothetical protein NE454_26570, partial [Blautia producta]|uniref:hypothetical protein n=1 Tax=Blautia producta TaxID=33035 RepID=UPI0021089F75
IIEESRRLENPQEYLALTTYGPKKLSFTSAMARMEWAKYAKEVYGKQWKQVYQNAVKELAKR